MTANTGQPNRPSLDAPVPSDVEAEEAVLGSILIDPENALPDVAHAVQPGDFYREKNGWIMEAMVALHRRGDRVDQITVAHQLSRQNRLEDVGGVAYLSQLVAMTPTSVHAEGYAKIVYRTAMARRIISLGGRIAQMGYEQGEPAEVLGRAQEELLKLSGGVTADGPRPLREIIEKHRTAIQRWLADPRRSLGVSTGNKELDATIGGFQPAYFYVLAARTSMGKSAVGLWLATNVARQGKRVIIYTLETSDLALVYRMVFSAARVNRYAIRLGQEREGWQEDVLAALDDLAALPIDVDYTAALKTSAMRARTARLKAKYGEIGLVLFDYANLAGDSEGQNQYERMSYITRSLQATAVSLNIPVLGLYQLNRGSETRDDKRPELRDLQDSGVIEQAASSVIFLYAPEYYYLVKGKDPPPEMENRLELIVAKQQEGPTGVVQLYFDRRTGFIAQLAKAEDVGVPF